MAVADLLADLDAKVTKATTAMSAAAILIRGIGARVQAAVDAATANGASAEQLAPVQAEVDALSTSADDLAAATVENTPAANA